MAAASVVRTILLAVLVIGLGPAACGSGGAEATGDKLSLVASRLSGVAPLAVFFDATATTSAKTPRPFHDLEYRWDFGDPGSGTWATGSRPGVSSRNSATGPVSAHVFEVPGTYTIALTVVDGTNTASNSTVQVTVQDPDVVFAGAKTACFSTSGNFTGCPGGANQVTTSNFITVTTSATSANTVRRLLLRRGETWTAAAPATLSATGPGIVGAFGAGASPIVQSTGNTTILALSSASTPGISDWRVMDLEFDGLGGASSGAVIGTGGASQMTLLRLNIHDASNGVQLSSSVLDFWNNNGSPGHVLWDQIAIVDSTIQRIIGGGGGNGMFLMADRLAVLGNIVDDSTAAEHVIRIQYASKAVIQANDLSLPAVNKHVLTLRAVDVGTGGVTGSGTTEKVVVSDNLFQGGLAALPVTFEPSNVTSDQRIRDVIFERNLIRAGSVAQTGLASSADEVTVRNNIIDMTSGAAGLCMRFDQRGAEPPHIEIRIYSNTCFSNGVAGGRVVTLDATNTNVTIKNNLGYAPNATSFTFLANAGSTNVVGGSGTFGNSSNFAIENTSPNFANSSGTFSNASDFALNAPSYAINTGVAIPVFSDFFAVTRPQSSGIDVGATEQ